MRYKPEHKQKVREEILAAAGRCMRLKGFNGIGVDGVMAEAGLTSGAFYSQFSSKTELLLEVVRAGLERLKGLLSPNRSQERQNRFDPRKIEGYLSLEHCQDVAGGCILPNLSVDVARADDAVKALYEQLLCQTIDEIEADMPSDGYMTERQRAWATLASMAGGILLARAMCDPETSEEILEACRCFVRQGLEPVDSQK
jgi:TetR/AcrR family transcriptional repressor of nem operon